MKTKILYRYGTLILLGCLISSILLAQSRPTKQWDKTFGGSDREDQIARVIQTSDGGYLAGGSSSSGISGDRTQESQGGWDYWIVKTDAKGIKQWDKRYGGNSSDFLTDFHQTSDGGYILGGSSASGISGDKTQDVRGGYDYWIVKINDTGSVVWNKRFGGSGDDQLTTLQQTTDGGYILGGYSYSSNFPILDKRDSLYGSCDYWIVKITSSGVYQWDRSYGGQNADELRSVIQTSDGGYMLAGSSNSPFNGGDFTLGNKTADSYGDYDYWVVKVNNAGNEEWQRSIGGPIGDYLYSCVQTSDQTGYVLGGWSGNHYWVVKVQNDGADDWSYGAGGNHGDFLQCIQETSDHGFILGGYSNSNTYNSKTQNSQGGSDYWIVKINSEGQYQWDADFGGGDEDYLYSVHQTTDGGYILGGASVSDSSGDKTQNRWNLSWDYWIVKTQPDCSNPQKYYRDFDKDGYGNPLDTILSCNTISGYVSNNTDCNDSNASIHPNVVEICGNGIDDNCNGQIDEGCSACANATNLTTTNITSTSAKLNWTASVNPVQWQVQYRKAISGVTWTNIKLAGSARSITISSLTANQKYNWHIRAKCGTVWTAYSAVKSFTTLAALQSASASVEDAAVAEKSSSFLLYPNPSPGEITVTFNSSNSGKVLLKVYDNTGKMVFTTTNSATMGNNTYHLNLSNLTSGIYYLELLNGNEHKRTKFMIQK